eukprot:scaffold268381_cov56-Attheya_sp.AAC.1
MSSAYFRRSVSRLAMTENGRRRFLTSRSSKDNVVDKIRDNTQRWIDEFIVKEKICPFAEASKVIIHVETFGLSPEFLRKSVMHGLTIKEEPEYVQHFICCLDNAHHQMEMLKEAEELRCHNPNLFLVWPVADLESFSSIASLIVEQLDLEDGSSGRISSDPRSYVAFPFHPLIPARQFSSPYAMLHIIPNKTLTSLRLNLMKQKEHPLDKNIRLFQDASREREKVWDDLVAECQDLVGDPAPLDGGETK